MNSLTASRRPTCTEQGKLLCTGCKDVKYCSAETQQADWPSHKHLCSSFKNFQRRPAEDMHRIIYFPKDAKKPEFMWRPLKHHHSDAGFEKVGMGDLINGRVEKGFVIQVNGMTGKPLGYTMYLRYDDDFMANYSKPNKAVTTAANGKLDFSWGGPVYAECGHGALDIVSMEDMDMGTFAALVAFLQDYSNDSAEQKARKGAKTEAVMVPASHPVFDSTSSVSAISERIGLPIHTIKYSPDQ
ncbi:hypothetical protein LTR85_007895 [Meristemomyces frigidus]|nr:hypothetical protein LTR85_007895 [Meristemomyces frigidus]